MRSRGCEAENVELNIRYGGVKFCYIYQVLCPKFLPWVQLWETYCTLIFLTFFFKSDILIRPALFVVLKNYVSQDTDKKVIILVIIFTPWPRSRRSLGFSPKVPRSLSVLFPRITDEIQ